MDPQGAGMTCPAIDRATRPAAVSGYLSVDASGVSVASVDRVRHPVRTHSRTDRGHVGSRCPSIGVGDRQTPIPGVGAGFDTGQRLGTKRTPRDQSTDYRLGSRRAWPERARTADTPTGYPRRSPFSWRDSNQPGCAGQVCSDERRSRLTVARTGSAPSASRSMGLAPRRS